jgi:hypothetical protein
MFSRFRTWSQTRKPRPLRKAARRRLVVEPLEERQLLTAPFASGPGAVLNLVLAQPQQASGPTGYTPAQLRQAYGFDQIPGLSNFNLASKGETIAIVDAYGDLNLRSDVQHFDETFDIGGATGDPTNTKFLQIVNEHGGNTLPAAAPGSGWDREESLDVQWAHAIAPGANILLVQANSVNGGDLNTAIQYAARQPNVCVVSMSFSTGSELPASSTVSAEDEYLTDGLYTTPVGHQGVAFVAASADYGAFQSPGVIGLFLPQASPNVLTVGGTTLPQDQDGNPDRSQEIGWSQGSDPYAPYLASGGGISTVEAQPAYQAGIQADLSAEGYPSGGYRTVPDVAYDADPGTGVPIYDTLDNTSINIAPGWEQYGGTSMAAPQWSALVAIADGARAAKGEGTLDGPNQLLPAVYQIAQTDPNAFQDITSGNNYYPAGPGYDLVTGLGTPNAQDLVPDLVAAYSTPPTRTTVYWTGAAGDDDWNDPGNWSAVDHVPGNVLPGPNNNVVIDTSGVTINHSSASYNTIGSLTVTGQNVTLNLNSGTLDLSGAGTLGRFQVDRPGDVVNLAEGALQSATVTSNTTITVPNAAFGLVNGGVIDGAVQIQGSGTLQLEGNWTNNGTITAGSGSTLILGDYWSAGVNDPSAASAAWVNNGTITTNQATVELGGWLTDTRTNLGSLNPGADTVDVIGTLDNAGHTLELAPGVTSSTGSWAFAGGRIDGGAIATKGGAALVVAPFAPDLLQNIILAYVLDGVTLDGTLDMSTAGESVNVIGGLTLNTDLNISGYNAYMEFDDSNPQSVDIGSAVRSATIHLSGDESFLANVGTQTLTFDPGITVSGESSGTSLVLGTEGEIDNRGTIEQNTPGDLQVGGFVNDGTIAASHGGVISLQTAFLGLGSPWINAPDGTITASDGGSLALYDNWINEGRIRVDASSAGSLGSPVTEYNYSPTPSYIWANFGTLAIAKSATVNLGDYITTDEFENHFRQLGVNLDLSQYTVNLIGTIDNSPADNPLTGGNLVLDGATGSLYLSGGVIDGGTITTTGRQELIATDDSYNYDYSGPYPIGGGTLNGVTLDGTLDMQSIPAATATVLNGLTLSGTIALTGSGAVLDLDDYDSTPETIGGTGIILFGHTSADYLQNTSYGTMTFGPGITIQGGLNSFIESPNAAIVNQGTLAQNSSRGVLAVVSPDPFSNAGRVTVGRGAAFNTGTVAYVQSGGTTTVDGILQAVAVDLDGGSLNGTGMICGSSTSVVNVVNAALIVPGDPFGTLTILGNYTQTATGVLLIQITGSNQYGRLAIAGNATLDGTLVVSLLDNFVPAAGTTFQILTFAEYTGGFTTEIGLGVPHHRSLKPVWGSGTLTLKVTG